MHAVRTLLLVLIAAAFLAPSVKAQEAPRPWGSAARTGRTDARRVRRTPTSARPETERARMATERRREEERSVAREQERERRRLQRRTRQQQLLVLQAQVAAQNAAETEDAERERPVTPPAETPNSYATEQCLQRFYSSDREQQCIESGAAGSVVIACVRWLYGAESEIACLSAASDAARVTECGQLHASSDDILACIRETP